MSTPNSSSRMGHQAEPQQKKRSAVQPEEIIAHLRILAAFHKLKLDVQGRSPHNPTGLWTAFLGYAVEKFASWITNVVDKQDVYGRQIVDGELREEEFPTLDVAMVWHAYILHPLEYYNDCQKSQRGLLRLRAFPVQRLAAAIDTLGLEPRFPVPVFGSRGVRIGPQFSLDLVAAVKRQASFVAQVAAVGWTQRPRTINDTATGAIDKYHGFLKKLWENPDALAVPTLEIDLAWHTHQLNVEQYRKDSMMLFGRILQHDDDIPSPELNKAFSRNSYDWKNLFHMDYSSGSICTGFRPVQLSPPVNSPSTTRPGSRDSSRTSSEISLQDLYQAVTEKRLSGGADGSSRASSYISFTPPSSSGRDSSPSPAPSIQNVGNTSLSRAPSSAGNNSPLGRVNGALQMLRPANDSTTTISGRPPSITFADSRASSTSELGSAIFAYSPPSLKNESRGAFDAPITTVVNLKLREMGAGKRPSSAGNAVPARSSFRRPKHQLSNSTGTLYIPEMPSPLSRPPEVNSNDWQSREKCQVERSPSVGREKESSLRPIIPRSVTSPSIGPVKNLPIGVKRPSSGGNGASRTPSSPHVSVRPSTSGGFSTAGKPISGPIKVFGRSSLSSRPVTADSKSNLTPSNNMSRQPSRESSSKRPSTAPPKQAPGAETEVRPHSSGLFRKKSKGERSPSSKRSWFKFW